MNLSGRQMGMGRHEWVVGWMFSESRIGVVTMPHPGSPGKELVSLEKAEGQRPSSLKACVAENPGQVGGD